MRGNSRRPVPLEDDCAVSAGDVVCNLCSKGFVVEEEEIELSDVVHCELLEAVGEHMAGLRDAK